jgi:hypothetical protein
VLNKLVVEDLEAELVASLVLPAVAPLLQRRSLLFINSLVMAGL